MTAPLTACHPDRPATQWSSVGPGPLSLRMGPALELSALISKTESWKTHDHRVTTVSTCIYNYISQRVYTCIYIYSIYICYIYTIFNYSYQLLELTVQPSLGMTSQKVLRLRYAASKWPICSRFTTPRNVLRTPWLLWERLHLASRLAEKKRTCWMYQVARQSPSAPRVQDHIEESWGICKKIREVLFSRLDLEGRCALSFQCLFRISLAGPLACRKENQLRQARAVQRHPKTLR